MQALKESGAAVPGDLEALAEAFQVKRKAGTAQAHGSGFGGSGFKFDAAEEQEHKAERKVQDLQSCRLDVCCLIVRIVVTIAAIC
jgi:ATP-dependent RNA helicase DDX46/PRP5